MSTKFGALLSEEFSQTEKTETKKTTPVMNEPAGKKTESEASDKIMEKAATGTAENEAVKETVKEIAKEEKPVQESTSESTREETKASTRETQTTKKRGAKRKLDEDLKADFLQIDIRGMRDYLSTITSYESMKNGDKMSFNTYIRGLIEKDMKKNAAIYENFKKMFE